MLYKVDNFENKKDEEIKDGVTDIIVSLCKRYLYDEYEYDKQDLLDALDELTDGSFDGAAYDTIKEFIEYYFNGHIYLWFRYWLIYFFIPIKPYTFV